LADAIALKGLGHEVDGIFVEVLGIDLGLNKVVVVVVFSATHLLMDGLVHCKENPIYVFLFWELRGLSPNFFIHVSVSDLYIPRTGPHISLQQKRQTDHGNV